MIVDGGGMVTIILYGALILGLLNILQLSWQRNARERYGRPIICLVGHDCEDVMLSTYSSALGISTETLGTAFYPAALLLLTIFVLFHTYFALGLLAFASFTATLYSVYLLVVQVMILKKYCFWYLASMVLNCFILGLVLSA